MGMPSISITFSELAATVEQRGKRGIIAMILKDKTYKGNSKEFISESDIPNNLSAANKEQIKLAMIGYEEKPKKVIAFFLDSAAETYEEAFKFFEVNKFNYLVVPTVETDGKKDEVVTFIKKLRNNGQMVKAVLPNHAADYEGIINYTTEKVSNGETEYTTEQYCSRIAGLIAGTPLTISCTYAPLEELTDCTKLNKEERDAAVNNGEFIVFWDGEKVKTGRAVTSFKTTTETKNNSFKKIKIVDTMDIIQEDITKTIGDGYLGKYANTYDNKGLLISAIMTYFDDLKKEKILETSTIDIDVDANRSYLIEKNKDVKVDGGETKALKDCTDDDFKKASTDEKVFLKSSISIYDSIEDVDLPISI